MTKVKSEIRLETRNIRFKRQLKLNAWCWLFMSLAVGFYVLFQGYPIICSIQYSLLDWSGMTSNATFVGLQNYKELMHDDLFWNAFINSFKYMVMIVPLELAVSLFLAYLLNDEKMKGRGLYRTMYFVPVVKILIIFFFIDNPPSLSLCFYSNKSQERKILLIFWIYYCFFGKLVVPPSNPC